ncbi:glycine betaine/L-proline ABC transporter, ATPase subunit [Syntrophobotulus glycolicus DSM 8271]|uniref:Quaternary amine transport ATP-binding protein n=1 Tax=Syntrophobotulus glycolicus (strain DSM 8271 / FlGlyR) TaxID=645991 RepID=F0SYQ2_SYNGF|nr:glycine betaine/L-proline ABC transporter ATP-binding protein [Syntrophobotulus glycolicus]ADY54853.1 glycine betaine/L-proline ABC transporter, ATPase subunit [Syntrophobotulus glycolicus DSM 8271]
MAENDKIVVKNLIKIFQNYPQKVLNLIEKGKSKEQILEETGQTVGINNVSFTVKHGEIFVVMGLSGSGKSTILRCINRLIKPSFGEIFIDDIDITKLKHKELRRFRQEKIAMVFQQFALLPHRTVLQNTVYGLEIKGIAKKDREAKALAVLNMVGLKGWENKYPSQLSGGMKQRVGLARALTNNTDILLMDEAFSALDPLIREEMQDELLSLQQKMNKTIVFITHDLNEALKLGDRIAFLKDGELIQVGTPEEIITNPGDDYVEKFVRGVDRSKLLTAVDVMNKPHPLVTRRDGPSVVLRIMKEYGISSVFVVDREKRLQGIITAEEAITAKNSGISSLNEYELVQGLVVEEDTPIQEIMDLLVDSKLPIAVIDKENKMQGIIIRGSVLAALSSKGGGAND